VIRTMEACIIQLELQRYMFPPTHFCPWPFWKGDAVLACCSKKHLLTAACEFYGTRIPALDEVRATSYTLQFFIMSSSSSKTAERDDAWLLKALKTDCVARRILLPFLTPNADSQIVDGSGAVVNNDIPPLVSLGAQVVDGSSVAMDVGDDSRPLSLGASQAVGEPIARDQPDRIAEAAQVV